jgi:hypothetical protein
MKESALPPAFYRPLGEGLYAPSEAVIGPWAPDQQHGGPPLALLAHALRTHEPGRGMHLVRLAVELLGPLPVQPCRVQVETLRPGRRVELLRACMSSQGRDLILAHAWRFETAELGSLPAAHPYQAPPLPPPQEQRFWRGIDYFPYGQAVEWRFAEGSLEHPGPATVWTRPRIPLLEGQPLHPLEALALMIDSANGISGELDILRWTFVPVDMTLSLLRPPQGEWFGMSARTHLGSAGAGQTRAVAFDELGVVGESLQTLFIRPR